VWYHRLLVSIFLWRCTCGIRIVGTSRNCSRPDDVDGMSIEYVESEQTDSIVPLLSFLSMVFHQSPNSTNGVPLLDHIHSRAAAIAPAGMMMFSEEGHVTHLQHISNTFDSGRGRMELVYVPGKECAVAFVITRHSEDGNVVRVDEDVTVGIGFDEIFLNGREGRLSKHPRDAEEKKCTGWRSTSTSSIRIHSTRTTTTTTTTTTSIASSICDGRHQWNIGHQRWCIGIQDTFVGKQRKTDEEPKAQQKN